jgi:hypothetical protein
MGCIHSISLLIGSVWRFSNILCPKCSYEYKCPHLMEIRDAFLGERDGVICANMVRDEYIEEMEALIQSFHKIDNLGYMVVVF